MPSADDVEMWGKIIDVFPGGKFKVKLETSLNEVVAYLSGKMRLNSIKIVLGDDVLVALSQYDMTQGRIIKRK